MDFFDILVPFIILLVFGFQALGKLFGKLRGRPAPESQVEPPVYEPRETKPSASSPRDIFSEVRRVIQERIGLVEQEPEDVPAEKEKNPQPKAQPKARPIPPPVPNPASPNPFKLKLRGSANLRRAVLYREILGPPTGLRRHQDMEF